MSNNVHTSSPIEARQVRVRHAWVADGHPNAVIELGLADIYVQDPAIARALAAAAVEAADYLEKQLAIAERDFQRCMENAQDRP